MLTSSADELDDEVASINLADPFSGVGSGSTDASPNPSYSPAQQPHIDLLGPEPSSQQGRLSPRGRSISPSRHPSPGPVHRSPNPGPSPVPAVTSSDPGVIVPKTVDNFGSAPPVRNVSQVLK